MLVPYVLKGYRVNHSFVDACRSLFSLHADTLNVWTHALGLLWFLLETPRALDQLHSNGSSFADLACFSVFIACAIFQMGSSASYHLFRCIGQEVEASLLRADIMGILSMILGSWVLAISQGFNCFPGYGIMYLCIEASLLAASLLLGTLAVRDAAFYPHYYLTVWSSVAFGVVPSIHHYFFICETSECHERMWTAQVGMFGNYALGFSLFLLRFPERAFPGVFDTVAHSHFWWHVFVFLAGRAWLLGMLGANDLKSLQGHSCGLG
jgi:adiponectin receptor